MNPESRFLSKSALSVRRKPFYLRSFQAVKTIYTPTVKNNSANLNCSIYITKMAYCDLFLHWKRS